MAADGGFDHQRQTMRVVSYLEERYPDFPGLNLTYEVREGLVKHDTEYDVTDAAGYEPDKAGTLECQCANIADEIAYNTPTWRTACAAASSIRWRCASWGSGGG